MEEKKKMERQDEKGRLAMAENNYGDNSTPLHHFEIQSPKERGEKDLAKTTRRKMKKRKV